MENRYFLIIFLLLLTPGFTIAQSDRDKYRLAFAPDAWYNDVDGIRVGVRVLGEMEGTFLDGPHRLDAGVWLGTWMPDLPVSYYLSFMEPIPAISDYGSEGNVQFRSSIRTGYSQHKILLNKRWQQGFDEFDFKEISIGFSREKLFDAEYRPFPQIWQNDWRSMAEAKLLLSNKSDFGRFNLAATIKNNLVSSANFSVGMLELKHIINFPKNFELKLRSFTGVTGDDTPPEYLFGQSYRQPVEWLNNGVSRAKGTLPGSMLENGWFHISGHANLRGYSKYEMAKLADGTIIQYNMVSSINAEIEFPNPVNALINESMAGDFVRFQSYIFADAGYFFRNNYQQTPDLVTDVIQKNADAGIGIQFSINIPDYLGKDRGFAIRYEIPLWLSAPEGQENNFKFRNLIGIGAVISL